MKQVIVKIVEHLPVGLRSFLKKTRSNLFRKQIISKWRSKGSPNPPPHEIKQDALKKYGEEYQCKILVETGTYRGDMIEIQKNNFEKLYSIELSETLWQKAVQRFSKNPRIQILQGDSGVVLHDLVPKLEERALFWLDGHFSSGVTAQGNLDCPIFGELDAIFNNNKKHIIVIDDAREFVGKNDYPTLEELQTYLNNNNTGYDMQVADDLIRLTPKQN